MHGGEAQTTRDVLRFWILEDLGLRTDHTADRRDVITSIYARHGHELTHDDALPRAGHPNTPNWVNQLDSERGRMVDDGLLVRQVNRGVWRLLPNGVVEYERQALAAEALAARIDALIEQAKRTPRGDSEKGQS